MVPKIASLEQHVEDAWEKHDTLAAKVARAAMNNQQEQQENLEASFDCIRRVRVCVSVRGFS